MDPSVQEKQIALVFDFDGTVAPDVMLAPIFDMIGIEPGMFWEKTLNFWGDSEISQAIRKFPRVARVPELARANFRAGFCK